MERYSDNMNRVITYKKMWYTCAVLLCIFPPAGLVMFIPMLIFHDKLPEQDEVGSYFLYGIGLGTAAWGCFELLLMVAISKGSSFDGIKEIIPVFLIFAIPVLVGIVLMCKCFSNKRREAEYDLCETIMCYGHILNIAEIAECLAKNMTKTEKIVQKTIEKRRLSQFSLNSEKKCVEVSALWAYKWHNCSYCGARLTIEKGKDLVCPYCGNPVLED